MLRKSRSHMLTGVLLTDAEFQVDSRMMSADEIRNIPGRITIESFPDRATVLQIAAIAGAIGATYLSMTATQEYDDARTVYNNARTLSDIESAVKDAQSKYDTASTMSTLQAAAIGAVAGVYLTNVVDALLTKPRVKLELRRSSLGAERERSANLTGIYASVRF